ncbi:MAG: FtsL-like putative cell division protein [Bacteroidota bacterium]
MNNRFREEIEQDTPIEEIEVKPKKKQPETDHIVRKFFVEGVISKEAATQMLPFLIFISVLCMLYIANSHMAVSNIRNIDKLNKEVKELSWEYKSLKADLMFKSKLTEVAKKVDTLGIKELTEPPKKIVISNNEY